MRRTHLFLGLTVAVIALALVVWRAPGRAQPKADKEAAAAEGQTLPLTQVILFNSGVGYFQREGAVDGNARVDLAFPVGDVNDLLKSLVLPDADRSKVSVVSYDSQEPVDRTLRAFALDLTYNPTFGQILNQARGEKVEITLQAAGNGANTLNGVIVGMEAQQEKGKEIHQLNLLCAEGMRCVPLTQVQRLRFLNATLDAEFRRALEVLASSRNSQKRRISLQLQGDGKHPLKLGYVVESPIWKTSYRLVLDKKGQATLQGWAVIENTTDEDWKDVRMALVSARPISFQMDLYQPLFVPRPRVDPERLASLRPPTYEGAIATGGQLGQNGGQAVGMMGMGGVMGFGGGLGQMGMRGGQLNAGPLDDAGNPTNSMGGSNLLGQFNRYQLDTARPAAPPQNRLTYEQLQQRRNALREAREKARALGSAIAERQPGESLEGVAGEQAGDSFQYTLDQKITLPRQKSAMLPIVHGKIEAVRVSIFNPAVHVKFPLFGVRFKNTTGLNLMQGPVAVFENGRYAGDARLPDMQPGEERLLSYAIDQGTEVKAEKSTEAEELLGVTLHKGMIRVKDRLRSTRLYRIKNRSRQERTLLVEHATAEGWKLDGTEKAAERTRDHYRFEWKVRPGQSAQHTVVQERPRLREQQFLTTPETTLRLYLDARVTSAPVKEALRKAVDFTARATTAHAEATRLEGKLKAIGVDQERLRANLARLPNSSAAYKRTVEKFDKQESAIEKLQGQIEEQQARWSKERQQLEEYLAKLHVE